MTGSDRTVKSVDIPNNQMRGRLYLCNEKMKETEGDRPNPVPGTGACPICGSEGPDHNAVPASALLQDYTPELNSLYTEERRR